MHYTVDYSEVFAKQLKFLKKKYPHCEEWIKKSIERLEQGELIGEPYDKLGLPPNEDIYKMRIPNPDAGKGTRGGFRVIYYVIRDDKYINLLAIYSKTEVDNITQKDILNILKSMR